jgi:hypothetical protein
VSDHVLRSINGVLVLLWNVAVLYLALDTASSAIFTIKSRLRCARAIGERAVTF